MPILRLIVPCMIALWCSGSNAGADVSASKTIFETPEGLFSRHIDDGAVEKLSDTAHYEKAARNGGHVYALLKWDDHNVWLQVLNCDAAGALKSTRTIVDHRLCEVTAIEWVDSLPDGRLFIECHVSPTLCVGVAIDIDRGQPLFLRGDGFTWPESGRHIAYFVEARRDVPPDASGKMLEVWLDGQKVRDVPADEFVGLSWNGRGTRLIVKLAGAGKPERHLVVTVNEDSSVAASK